MYKMLIKVKKKETTYEIKWREKRYETNELHWRRSIFELSYKATLES